MNSDDISVSDDDSFDSHSQTSTSSSDYGFDLFNQEEEVGPYRTKYGRVVKPPNRFSP